jgi:hypothetical protein
VDERIHEQSQTWWLSYQIVTDVLPFLYVRSINYDLADNRQCKWVQVGKFLRTWQPTLGVNPGRV